MSTQKLFFYSITTPSKKKYVVAINENERAKQFSVSSGMKIMAYVLEVQSATESVSNADLIKTSSNLLNKTIAAYNAGEVEKEMALISLNYVSNGKHLFTSTTDHEIEFNTQSLWHKSSDNFKSKIVKLIANWDLNSPTYAN